MCSMLISYFNFCDIEGVSDKVKGEGNTHSKSQVGNTINGKGR